MESTAEVARVRKVYRQYAAWGLGQSRWSSANKGNQAIQLERERKTQQLLMRAGFFPLSERRILDVGCGTGEQLDLFLDWGARPENLFGIDLLPERIRVAQQKLPKASFQTANAESLPYEDAAFDLVSVFTVFTSILDRQMAANVSLEIARVLKTGGAVLWYDFRMNNPLNKHVGGVTRKQIQNLFPGFGMALETISLLPPVARRLGAATEHLYSPLQALSFLRTHLLGLLTKP